MSPNKYEEMKEGEKEEKDNGTDSAEMDKSDEYDKTG